MVEALNFGHQAIKQIIGIQKELYAKIQPKKVEVPPPAVDEGIAKKVEHAIRADLEDALDTHKHEKMESYALVDAAKKKAAELFPDADDEKLKMVKTVYNNLKEKIFRDQILHKPNVLISASSTRSAQRSRPAFPRTHGSAVFTRGTQALVIATLNRRRCPANGSA
jgi:polyribonucleotide nucleotidyltransferase